MNGLRSITMDHPILFALSLPVAWFVLAMIFTGMASSALRKPIRILWQVRL